MMRTQLIAVLGAVVLTMSLAGCQTAQESASDAHMTCSAQGLRPGTTRYERCVNVTYQSNRQHSAQAENAAVLGVAAGLVGGAVIGASIDDHHHYRGYRRCNRYRCW